MKQSINDLCRELSIPFSQADALLYRLQEQKDNFEIFCCKFHELVNNKEASPEAQLLMEEMLKKNAGLNISTMELKNVF